MDETVGNVLITNTSMVLPDGIYVGDIRIHQGFISEIMIDGSLELNSNEIKIDGTGLHLLPGIIDPQCHFRDPGQPEKEDLASGSAAAVSGGVTSFLDMPNNVPSITTLEAMLEKIETAQQKCVNNFGFFVGATPNNLTELQRCVGDQVEAISHPGICGIKVFMGSSTGDLLVNEEDALEQIFSLTSGLIAVHAEDETRMLERYPDFEHRTDIGAHAEWRDDKTALIATQRAVRLAERYGHRLHILHLTSGIESEWLTGKTSLEPNRNLPAHITTETLPQHLTFNDIDVEREDTRLKMNPPIRYQQDQDELWNGLHQGTIQCIATDHAPHTLESKALGFPKAPSGMPGVETSLPVMLTHAKFGKCTIEDVARWMSTNVAECYRMKNKGRIEVGFDGDVVLVDMNQEYIVKDETSWTKVGWNPFRGIGLVGWPTTTIVGGIPVFERTSETGQKGRILVSPGEVGSPLIMGSWSNF